MLSCRSQLKLKEQISFSRFWSSSSPDNLMAPHQHKYRESAKPWSCPLCVGGWAWEAVVRLLSPHLARQLTCCSVLAFVVKPWDAHNHQIPVGVAVGEPLGRWTFFVLCPCLSRNCRSEAWTQVAFQQANLQLWICFLVISFQLSNYLLR